MDIDDELKWMRHSLASLCRSGAITCRIEVQLKDRWLVVKGHRWPSGAYTISDGDAETLEAAEEIADHALAAEVCRQKHAAFAGRLKRAVRV